MVKFGFVELIINPVMKVDQYPLSHIMDVFASLAGGQKFSKIYLTQAYNQMEVEESSRKLLTINTHRGLYNIKVTIWRSCCANYMAACHGPSVERDAIYIMCSR